MAKEKEKPCCKKSGLKEGVAFGLLPHVGCIAFLAFSLLGVTAAAAFFRPLLLNPAAFYVMIALSFGIMTVSAFFYLRRLSLLTLAGARSKWKYLSVMYSSAVAVNLAMFFVVFPAAVNVDFPVATASPAGPATMVTPASGATGLAAAGFQNTAVETVRLAVNIPCSGHAPLIKSELMALSGVKSVKFSFPNVFAVEYDPAVISKDAILSASIFRDYPAAVV